MLHIILFQFQFLLLILILRHIMFYFPSVQVEDGRSRIQGGGGGGRREKRINSFVSFCYIFKPKITNENWFSNKFQYMFAFITLTVIRDTIFPTFFS